MGSVFMYNCDECNIKFDNYQQKANHVRWQHKKKPYTKKSQLKIKDANRKAADKKYGKLIVETINCPKCKKKFERRYRELSKKKPKQFCSRSCSNRRRYSAETRKKLSDAAKKNPAWIANRGKVHKKNKRFSSKIERALAKKLKASFRRHKQVILDSGRRIDVDIVHKTKNIWIESDGPYHFEKVHKNHDYEKSKQRDIEENKHCEKNGILLIRVNNFKYTLAEQVEFIREQVKVWDNCGKVVKLY